MWHHDVPPDLKEVYEVVAKALMMRARCGMVVLTKEELLEAARTSTEIALDDDAGSLMLRVERQ